VNTAAEMTAHILIVDDEVDIANWLARYLRRAGHNVVSMHDSLEAWEAFQAQPFDLVITDLRMPQLDGEHLTAQIKALAPKTQVVVLTGHGTEPDIERLIKLGVSWVFHKPLREVKDLVALVEQLLALARSTNELAAAHDLFDQALAAMSDSLFITDRVGTVVRVNLAALQLLGVSEAQIIGQPFSAFCKDTTVPSTPQQILERAPSGQLADLEAYLHHSASGVQMLVSLSCAVMRDTGGALSGSLVVARDVGALRALTETVSALSTPVIPIFDGMLVLPLVGTIDSARSQQITAELLEGVQAHQAQVVIIDITGVPLVDTQVANHLIQAVRAVGLLGARCLLVGIRPEIAASLVSLGVKLGDIQTCANLQDGVQRALRLLGLEVHQSAVRRRGSLL